MHRTGTVLIMNAGMEDYYAEHLAAEKLRRCYEIAPPRVRQYLRAELDFALGFIHATDSVLDLGCGYGRTLPDLAARAAEVTAIDNAPASVTLARQTVAGLANVAVREMDAGALQFDDGRFDVVLCLQNGISAFHRDPGTLMLEALRVCRLNTLGGVPSGGCRLNTLGGVPSGGCRPGGVVLFSTYAERFWPQRLEWFQLQAEAGLLGEIDWQRTGNGHITCKDGFTATTFTPDQFRSLASNLPAALTLTEVDGSSLFCILRKSGLAG
ncbi:MAG: class I SAM-dependent methyltransferase [Candidatus Aminicenantes bacterium]|nr:class I SAM-dependent methyltransferase [Candidatus Aminicenantes bacterium]